MHDGQVEDGTETSERADSTAEVIEFLNWAKNGYSQARSTYKSGIRQVFSLADDLMNTIDGGDNVTEAEVDLLIETARRYDSIGQDVFGDYYSSHPNYRGIVNAYEPEIRRNQRRGESELLYDTLGQFRQYYAHHRTQEVIDVRYPLEPVVGGPADLFMHDTAGSSFVFEVSHQNSFGKQSQFIYSTEQHTHRYDGIRIRQSPFDHLSAEVDLGYAKLFESENSRISESVIRAHKQHELTGDIVDLEAEDVASSVFYIQTYDSVEAAEAAHEELRDGLAIEAEEEKWGSHWERTQVANGSASVYAHLAQDLNYILAVGMSTTPWEERSMIGESNNWDLLIASTWIQI